MLNSNILDTHFITFSVLKRSMEKRKKNALKCVLLKCSFICINCYWMVALEQLIDGIHTCHSSVSGTVQVSWEPSLQHRITWKYRIHQRQISKPVHFIFFLFFHRDSKRIRSIIICTLNLCTIAHSGCTGKTCSMIHIFFFLYINWIDVMYKMEQLNSEQFDFGVMGKCRNRFQWSKDESRSVHMVTVDKNICQWIFWFYFRYFMTLNRRMRKNCNSVRRYLFSV